MYRIILAILFLSISLLYAFDKTELEDFEDDITVLKSKGWFIPKNSIIDNNCAFRGNSSIRITVSPESKYKYISYFIPVEPQKKYRAEVWIKYKNIKKNNLLKYSRGAVLFCQFSDRNRKWVSGGTFPLGFFEEGGWRRNRVLIKNQIPQNVKYVKVQLGIEGEGTAWFDSFKFDQYIEDAKEVTLLKDEDYNLFKKNKPLTVNGKPFFPIGCYRDPDDNLLNISNIVDVGFNLTHSYDFEHGTADIYKAKEYLNLCKNNNLKVFMGIDRQKIKNNNFNWIKRWVNELKDYHALFTWYLYDEPEHHGITSELLQRLNSNVKSIDSLNTTSILLNNSRCSEQYYDSYDILMVDEYPIPNRNIEMVSHKLKEATEMINGSKPVIAVLQAYDKKGKEKIDSGKELVRPTYDEIRCMTFLALASGVDGIIYYWSPSYKYHLKNQAPKVWNGLIKVIKELNGIMPYLLSTDKTYYKFDRLFNLEAWSSIYNGKKLFTIINTSENSFEINISLSKIEFNQLINIDTSTIFNKESNVLKCKFYPYEVKVFYLL